MPSLVKIGPVILERKIFKDFVKVISLFRNYLPLEKGMAGPFLCTNYNPIHQMIICAKYC